MILTVTDLKYKIKKTSEQTKLWYVLYVKYKHEISVQEHVNSLEIDIEAYCPTQFVIKQWKDRKKKILTPLLPKIVLIKNDIIN